MYFFFILVCIYSNFVYNMKLTMSARAVFEAMLVRGIVLKFFLDEGKVYHLPAILNIVLKQNPTSPI